MPRDARKARNQALFREVNQRIAALATLEGTDDLQQFICECSQLGCTESVQLPAEVYARIRDDPTMFLVRPGHEDSDHELVVARSDGYMIVRHRDHGPG